MLIYGASGHAKIILSILEENNIKVNAIYDDDLSIKNLGDYNVMGTYKMNKFIDDQLIIAVGANKTRKLITERVSHQYGQAIHNSSLIDKEVNINKGSVVFHNAVIQRGTIIGRHVIINTSASIDHDNTIEDFVHVSPNASLAGNISIGEGTHIGIGAIIIQNIKIGKWCTIGAGTVIIRDIPDYAIVVGNPGRIIKYNDRNE